jgi:DNA-binding NtrC family response regulator
VSKPTLTTALIEQRAGSRLELARAEVRVVAGPDRGETRELDGGSIRIGTSAECEWVLHDPSVSACHAEILATTTGYVIRDLGSKNGLLLRSFPIERAPLSDGMRLELGETALLVRALGAKRSVALASAGQFAGLAAHSVKMRALVSALEQLADSDASVVIEGESGSGKERVAHAIHLAGPRRRGPFVVVDCAALPAALALAELCGHERGAFTGAESAREGLCEQADGGTLFLDEVGELPLAAQSALLGLVERRSVRRVGGREARNVDLRIVAATNRNLEEEARTGRFRPDLLYRLAVVKLRVPALRERPEDIAPLAREMAREAGVSLTPELLALLQSHAWPGNVRELRNTIARLQVKPELALPEAAAIPPLHEARRAASDAFERSYLERLLAREGGNVTRAAELAGISRQMLTRLVAKHGLAGYGRTAFGGAP